MSKCPNCGTAMTCGCQRRTLANGKQGCSKCITVSGKSVESVSAPKINEAILKNKE